MDTSVCFDGPMWNFPLSSHRLNNCCVAQNKFSIPSKQWYLEIILVRTHLKELGNSVLPPSGCCLASTSLWKWCVPGMWVSPGGTSISLYLDANLLLAVYAALIWCGHHDNYIIQIKLDTWNLSENSRHQFLKCCWGWHWSIADSLKNGTGRHVL